MIENPMFSVIPLDPEIACPSGWHDLRPIAAPYHGHGQIALDASGVVRLHYCDETQSVCGCSRLFFPGGDIVAGLYTDRGQVVRRVGHAGRRGKVMADSAGRQFLRGRLPWSSSPVQVPEGSPLAALGVPHYPFSALTHVLVTSGGPPRLLDASVAACHPDVLRAHGGVPVLCLPAQPDGGRPDLGAVPRIKWPEGVTVYAMGPELADQIVDEIFVDVDEWPF